MGQYQLASGSFLEVTFFLDPSLATNGF